MHAAIAPVCMAICNRQRELDLAPTGNWGFQVDRFVDGMMSFTENSIREKRSCISPRRSVEITPGVLQWQWKIEVFLWGVTGGNQEARGGGDGMGAR
jgi:hypothetical protein